MNPIQTHLILNHLPIAFVMVGAPLLGIALWRKSQELKTVALGLLLLAGICSVPVSLSGEASAEFLKHVSETTRELVREHEQSAELALVALQILAIISLTALAYERFKRPVRVVVLKAILVGGALNFALLVHAAHHGGQITHPEVQGTQFFETK
jgi:hypothetical protein